MNKLTLLIVNGPNLGHLGTRQPEIYGHTGMDAVPGMVENLLGPDQAALVGLEVFQSNHEGEIIDRLERAWQEKVDGVIVNAGALTHTSLALGDCLAWIKLPCVEVHLSNLAARKDEPLRARSFVGPPRHRRHCRFRDSRVCTGRPSAGPAATVREPELNILSFKEDIYDFHPGIQTWPEDRDGRQALRDHRVPALQTGQGRGP